MKKRYGVVTIVLVMIMAALLGCAGVPTPEGRVPIKTAEKPLEDSQAPGEYVVTWRGQVLDALSKQAIQPAFVTFLTPEGVFTFEGNFEVAIPANRVTRFRAMAPGYKLGMSEIKPHFQRDAEIKGNIELDPWPLRLRSGQAFGPYADIIEDLESRFPQERYGRYPQLLESSSWVEMHQEEAILRYRREGDDVWRWAAWDSFELSYGIRAYLLNRYPDLVQDVALCLIERTSTIGEEHTPSQRHVVPWVIFANRAVLALDLTPLGVGVNPMHIPTKIYVGDEARDEIARQFEAYKTAVSLKQGVPMKVEERGGKTYYVMAAINVQEDEYQFLLQAYEIHPATEEGPLEFVQGGLAGMRIAKDAFNDIQNQMRQEDPFVLRTKAGLLTREGSRDPDLERVLNGNLDILYYLITKVQLGPLMPSAFGGGRL